MNHFAWLATIAAVAGLMRGFTGFGGSMVMAPIFSLILGPVPAVVTALIPETLAALVMFRDAWRKVDRRLLTYLIVPACFTVPVGGYVLVTLDPVIARKLIAGIVVLFSIILLLGLRFNGKPHPLTSVLVGGIVGVLVAATSVGAPPVILYLLSGPDPAPVTRANLTVFITSVSAIGLAMLGFAGAITGTSIGRALILSIGYLIATWMGGALFEKFGNVSARRVSLCFMLVAGTIGLAV